eukprot:UN02413
MDEDSNNAQKLMDDYRNLSERYELLELSLENYKDSESKLNFLQL